MLSSIRSTRWSMPTDFAHTGRNVHEADVTPDSGTKAQTALRWEKRYVVYWDMDITK
ncbi:hypothetical protein SAMN05216337_104298 [Bradyrhizobium brasilense]|uniref:Uncharacterized protein n=1 Tax=Bradyrhizobium brasilense TaxID=1419277 RepID=A0A1G7HQI1_9BRAD|nr:hypothetical protein [Bradyrhizobium brasilense]SDF02722.1 hypothetical protein SAMN05216337_104298 [Bradyrhizobium brasilense]